MSYKETLKNLFRPYRDIVFSLTGFVYDFIRFFKYSGWKNQSTLSVRDFKAVKIYHRLEKSLSFRNRDNSAGQGAALDLFRHLKKHYLKTKSFTHHEIVALKVLQDFLEVSHFDDVKQKNEINAFLESNKSLIGDKGGVVDKDLSSIQSGMLENPDTFFLSRCSVRDFDSTAVSLEIINHALSLALNSPSVCNRQASFVYVLNTRQEIDKVLSLQNGNRGFGHEIPCLMILCGDLSAFDASGERYQHWIDGGMFSMSIIWALHALGLSSCCLNWSKGPVDDLKLRRMVNINNEHTILMMLAVGTPKKNLKVCYSARKPVETFYKVIG